MYKLLPCHFASGEMEMTISFVITLTTGYIETISLYLFSLEALLDKLTICYK